MSDRELKLFLMVKCDWAQYSKYSSIFAEHLRKIIHFSFDRFESLVVLEFEKNTPSETVEWVLSKLTAPPNNGGGQLLANTTTINTNGKQVQNILFSMEELKVVNNVMNYEDILKVATVS